MIQKCNWWRVSELEKLVVLPKQQAKYLVSFGAYFIHMGRPR
jgi:hypothetical protein